ncbi:MAG: hypothetical protein GYA59_11900 [Chloroflexi bacterium]|nr:hypothetical protein [Chloroflexota bacterium]
MQQLVLLCLSIAPFILFSSAVLGILGVMPVGPRETPPSDSLNRQMSIAFLAMGAGLLLWQSSNQALSDLGLGASLVGVVAYFVLFQRARKKFPPVSNTQYIKQTQERIQAKLAQSKEEKKEQ